MPAKEVLLLRRERVLMLRARGVTLSKNDYLNIY
jgi:hypothetical protein